jgi:hypothetical protein
MDCATFRPFKAWAIDKQDTPGFASRGAWVSTFMACHTHVVLINGNCRVRTSKQDKGK